MDKNSEEFKKAAKEAKLQERREQTALRKAGGAPAPAEDAEAEAKPES